MFDQYWDALKVIGMFAGIFIAFRIGRYLLKCFGPILKLWGNRPY